MKITKGEYCQFNLKSKVELLKEFGQLEFERSFGSTEVRIFTIYDFYVEVIYNQMKEEIEKVEPVNFMDILRMYDNMTNEKNKNEEGG
ncbi:hypothetical protein [Dinghuibacter silviterrae]|uniref:Uncharacterized protein n=1 Tax=Dinghuibacter silviterrae TaxID=1539049 RepID=A0A4R8DJV8_9BACT|nr:hypothetical protein [Dinghuibacter silviterrae]TDW97290.1 hypothetical protein EDB95_5137 [Dinghuibacter silviterrae]